MVADEGCFDISVVRHAVVVFARAQGLIFWVHVFHWFLVLGFLSELLVQLIKEHLSVYALRLFIPVEKPSNNLLVLELHIDAFG